MIPVSNVFRVLKVVVQKFTDYNSYSNVAMIHNEKFRILFCMIKNKDESDTLFNIMMHNTNKSSNPYVSYPVIYAFFHDCVITKRCIDTVLAKPKSFINNTKQYMIPFRHRVMDGTIPLLGINHLRIK